jgi:hypothetical protein
MRTTVKVDLTRQTKQWNRIQIASAFTLFISLGRVVSMPFDIIKHVHTEQSFDYTGLLFQIPFFSPRTVHDLADLEAWLAV